MNEFVRVSPAKSGIMYGVIFGVIMVLEFVAAYVLDIDAVSNPSFGIVLNVLNFLVLPILFIIMGCNNFKKINGGFLSFGQSLKIGVTICLIAALIYSLFNVVFTLIFPEYIEEILRKTRSVMLQNNPEMDSASIEMGIDMTRKFMQPALMVPVTLVTFSVIGLIFSLIIGAILKREKPESL